MKSGIVLDFSVFSFDDLQILIPVLDESVLNCCEIYLLNVKQFLERLDKQSIKFGLKDINKFLIDENLTLSPSEKNSLIMKISKKQFDSLPLSDETIRKLKDLVEAQSNNMAYYVMVPDSFSIPDIIEPNRIASDLTTGNRKIRLTNAQTTIVVDLISKLGGEQFCFDNIMSLLTLINDTKINHAPNQLFGRPIEDVMNKKTLTSVFNLINLRNSMDFHNCYQEIRTFESFYFNNDFSKLAQSTYKAYKGAEKIYSQYQYDTGFDLSELLDDCKSIEEKFFDPSITEKDNITNWFKQISYNSKLIFNVFFYLKYWETQIKRKEFSYDLFVEYYVLQLLGLEGIWYDLTQDIQNICNPHAIQNDVTGGLTKISDLGDIQSNKNLQFITRNLKMAIMNELIAFRMEANV